MDREHHEPQPRKRVDDFIRGPQVNPVLGGVVVERQQPLEIVGDLRNGLAELRSVGCFEAAHGIEGVLLVLGVPDLGQGLLRPRMRRLR
jgi:hypothetical protein